MNEVSIIINGVRYDAVEVDEPTEECLTCALKEYCDNVDIYTNGGFTALCAYLLESPFNFKKSTKSFER